LPNLGKMLFRVLIYIGACVSYFTGWYLIDTLLGLPNVVVIRTLGVQRAIVDCLVDVLRGSYCDSDAAG